MRRLFVIVVLMALISGCADSGAKDTGSAPPTKTASPLSNPTPAKDIYSTFNGEEFLAAGDSNGDGTYDYREKRYGDDEAQQRLKSDAYQNLVDKYGAISEIRYIKEDTDLDGEMDTARIFVNGELYLETEYDPLTTIWDLLSS